MPDQPDLNALLGSRICHDLISPLGAIANGVELMMMSGAAATPEVTLIAESVANANARIRFFRVAFGQAGPDQRMGRPEITSILADISKGGRISLDWQVPGDIARPEVKLAFLALMCCETAMPYGGRISFVRSEGIWQISAAAAKLKFDEPLWQILSHAGSDYLPNSAQVHFPLLLAELRAQKRLPKISHSATDILMDL